MWGFGCFSEVKFWFFLEVSGRVILEGKGRYREFVFNGIIDRSWIKGGDIEFKNES